MSQLPRFSRARLLTASVWPGKATEDYQHLVAARVRKLAATGSTGMLPFTGVGDGAIYFQDGAVVLAQSARTPGPSVPAGLEAPAPEVTAVGPDGATGGPAGAVAGPDGPDGATEGGPYLRLTTALAVAEPTVDAVVELLSTESRCAKFRAARAPAASGPGIGVEGLLAEVARRQRVLHQLSPVVTADTVVARNPDLSTPHIRVSGLQWALLIRVRDGSTPRALAWELGRSVFATTLETYRLLALRLLSTAGHRAHRGGREPEYGLATMSFVRAVTSQEGGTMTVDRAGHGELGADT
ncbi:MAG TPA: hypothetical protein VGD68_16525 [Streptosporangiaceae bacterium]